MNETFTFMNLEYIAKIPYGMSGLTCKTKLG